MQLLDLGRRVPDRAHERIVLEALALREEPGAKLPLLAARELLDALRVADSRWMSASVWRTESCTRAATSARSSERIRRVRSAVTLLRRAPQPRAYDKQQAACECRRRQERAAGAGVASRGEEHDSGGYDQDAAEHPLPLSPEKKPPTTARTAEI